MKPARPPRAAAMCAEAFGLRLAAALADRAVAAVALASRELDIAAEKAVASATVADAVGVPIEAALSRMLAGRALAQDGQRKRASAELTKAADAFHSSGALRYRDQAEQQLRQLGQHIHRRTRAGKSDGVGVELLTERQLQIAHLVVARRTNPRDRVRAVPQPKDGRKSHAQHVRQGGRQLSRRSCAGGRESGQGDRARCALVRVRVRTHKRCRFDPTTPSAGAGEEGVHVGGELAVVLEEEAVGRVRVDREPRVREEPGQEVRVARQDHRVAVAVGDEHREVDRGDALEQRVVGDAPRADGVVLRLAGLPGRRLVSVGRPPEDAPGGLLACLATRVRRGEEDGEVSLRARLRLHRPRRSPPAPSRASRPHPAVPRTRARRAAAGRGG